VLNRSPTKALNNKTPFEAWHGKKPRVSHLKVFGCVAHVKVVGPGLDKLYDRSSKMVFIGYKSGTKGYRLFDPATNRLVVSRDVIFVENQPWSWNNKVSSTSQQETKTFTVHYEETDRNPTTAENIEDAVNPTADAVGEGSAGQEGVVGPFEAAPNSPITPGSSVAPNLGWATPPSQNSVSTDEGPIRFRTLTDLLDSTEEVHDFEYSGVCMLAADEPISVEQAFEESC
jgi:hypothetical protein